MRFKDSSGRFTRRPVPEGTKYCASCESTLPTKSFHKHKGRPDGLDAECKSCRNHRSRTWRKENKEKQRYSTWTWRLKTIYGISAEEYEYTYKLQEGKCSICMNNFERLVVDHDAISGRFRGLLCMPCNLGIGSLKHNSGALRRAAAYLERHLTEA